MKIHLTILILLEWKRRSFFASMSIVMYVKPGCPYCQRARDYYNENGIDFIEYDAQNDRERQIEMLELTGGDVTVPAIVMDGEHVQSGWGEPPRG